MLNLISYFIVEDSDIDNILQEIRYNHRSFIYDIKYILIETKFTNRLLKHKNQYIFENLRKKLEEDDKVIIVETDLILDPKIKNVPIIKDDKLYKNLIKNFDGYVAFKYEGPLEQIKEYIEYLKNLGYCDFCSYDMIYQIDLYKIEEHINFLYVKILTQ